MARPSKPPERLWTVPNVLCILRLVGSPGLMYLAWADSPRAVLWLYVVLAATDWIDGKLAMLLDQRSAIGPRLDSFADAAMYAGLLFAAVWLRGETLQGEWIWIASALALYCASCGAALWKFGRLPSYHTRSAKTAWLLMAVAAVALFLDASLWPLRIAMLAVAVANLEGLAITWRLDRWQTDVISFRAAMRMRSYESFK